MINELQLGISVKKTKNTFLEKITPSASKVVPEIKLHSKSMSRILLYHFISHDVCLFYLFENESPDFQEMQHTETKDRLHKGVPSRTTEAMTDQLSHFPADRW